MPSITYRDHPEQPGEDHKTFDIIARGGDYIFFITDNKTGRSIHFRYCMSGGFGDKLSKTTEAVAELYRALKKEGDN